MTDYAIVDVFAETAGGGNPLAVVFPKSPMGTDTMQAIAVEFGFSETTFVAPAPAASGAWPTRIFSPRAELPFAGHPTLGSAAAIRERFNLSEMQLTLALGVGPVTVERDAAGTEWMTPPVPELGETVDGAPLAAALGLSPQDLHPSLPAQRARVGVSFLIVPLRNLDAVTRARSANVPSPDDQPLDGVLIFCPQAIAADNDLHVRVFAPAHGIVEDPATGSANTGLAHYLRTHRAFDSDPLNVRAEQGHAIHRPSVLHLRSATDGTLRIGGQVRPFARGELTPPRSLSPRHTQKRR